MTCTITISQRKLNIALLKQFYSLVYNEIVNAMSTRRLTGLCMLDLSAAFDVIDHKILREQLSSWFGIKGTVSNGLTSFVSKSTFSVKVLDNLSSF